MFMFANEHSRLSSSIASPDPSRRFFERIYECSRFRLDSEFFFLFFFAVFISLPIHFRALVFVAVRSHISLSFWHSHSSFPLTFTIQSKESQRAEWRGRSSDWSSERYEIKKRMKRRNPLLLMGSTQQHRARVSHLLLFFHYFRSYSTFNSIRMKSTNNNSKIHETSTWRDETTMARTHECCCCWSETDARNDDRVGELLRGWDQMRDMNIYLIVSGDSVPLKSWVQQRILRLLFFDFFSSFPCEWIVVQLTFTSQ